ALAATAVVTTGVGVLAQDRDPFQGGSGPSDDRLGAVEKKLDRILEALGGTHGDVKAETRGGRTVSVPRSEDLAPAGAASTSSDSVTTGTTISSGGNFASSRSHPIDARVADLERRLADLERRFDAMERRLSRATRPG